jgi:dienelactone hydrolase
MKSFLALLAFLTQAGLHVDRVSIPAPDGTALDAALVQPDGPPEGSAVVALHGCGGPFPSRDGSWAVTLAHAGHIVLLPDSFGPRGLGSQCGVKELSVTPSKVRRQDAIAAAAWLAGQPGTPPGGVDLVGWSNGGGTVLCAAAQRPDLPPGLFRRFVAFYPGCGTVSREADWRPARPLLILVGESDDWTPAEPCHDLAARFPGQVELVTYPGAYHDFDAPDRAVEERSGLATPPGGSGHAHTRTHEPARQDALRRVPAFLNPAGTAKNQTQAGLICANTGMGSINPPVSAEIASCACVRRRC